MASELEKLNCKSVTPALDSPLAHVSRESGDSKLLLQAFEMFTQASSSLESAFDRLQTRVQRLTEELEAKNIELERSLREKQEAQNYLRTILELLPCGVFVLDRQGNLTLCNPMASEVLQQPKIKSTRRGKSNRQLLNPEMRNSLAAAACGAGAKAEMEISFAEGREKRILATSGTPLADAAGCRTGTVHIIRDITEMKALQEKNQRIERLSAMGEMAVELAHEIRNPLASIELFASLLANELTSDTKRWADNIQLGIQSLNTIVSNMLQFANPVSPSFAESNLHEIVHEILKFCEPLLSQRRVYLKEDLKAQNPMIWADRDLIRQMMLNLIFNAMKAMPSEGSLAIGTRNSGPLHERSRAGGLELQIRDTGVGIPTENLHHIFDPFFTTNKNGTGLGLSVVHQIVELHAGTIQVASKVNLGTTFTIVFDALPEKE
jgi:PAS domain S-box-containing protein